MKVNLCLLGLGLVYSTEVDDLGNKKNKNKNKVYYVIDIMV